MTTTLALVRTEEASEVPPETILLGLPLIRRTVLSAPRAGFLRVSVVGVDPDTRSALAGTPAEFVDAAPEVQGGAFGAVGVGDRLGEGPGHPRQPRAIG